MEAFGPMMALGSTALAAVPMFVVLGYLFVLIDQIGLLSDPLRDLYGKYRSFAVFTLRADLTIHHIGKLGSDRKSESDSVTGPGSGIPQPVKGPEYFTEFFLFDAPSGIRNLYLKADTLSVKCR